MALVCLKDYEEQAAKFLPFKALNYYKCGSGEMTTVQLNKDSYKKLRIRPKCLQDVSSIDLSTSILGFTSSMPIGISPTANHKFAHPEGELATARAAEKAGVIYTLSNYASTTIEDVAEAAPNLTKWFQLYIFYTRSVSEALVRRAEASGYKAIVLTVDSPHWGTSYEVNRHGHQGRLTFVNVDPEELKEDRAKGRFWDKTLSWDVGVKWLVGFTKLPVIAKGILRPEDAVNAINAGCQAIIVSNHGGRNLDTTPATIEVLPEILAAVNGRVPVIIDGGITLGTDVLKALAIGADMVFIGRPIIWGLAVKGQEGVEEVLSLLKTELENAMMFSGTSTVNKITKDLVVHESYYEDKLKKWLSE